MISNSHIEVRPNRAGKPRAYIVGTRVRVQDIYVDSEVYGMTPDEIAAGYPQLTLAQVHAALRITLTIARKSKARCVKTEISSRK